MTFAQLRLFTTVAQLENISKAAEYLHVSQSSLSKQIARLEAELGVQLFDRKGKKITLNKAGMLFYDSGSLILEELQSAEENLKRITYKQNNRIKIGVCGIPEQFGKCLKSFSVIHPEAEYLINNKVEFENHTEINDYDMLICPESIRYEKLNGSRLYDEGYHFAVSTASAAADEPSFPLRLLKEQPVIFLRGDDLAAEFPFRVCSALGAEPKTAYFTDSREIHREMIANGSAAGFVPKTEVAKYAEDRHIRLLPILDQRFTRPMKICFLREKHLTGLGIEFRRFVSDFYGLDSGEANEK